MVLLHPLDLRFACSHQTLSQYRTSHTIPYLSTTPRTPYPVPVPYKTKHTLSQYRASPCILFSPHHESYNIDPKSVPDILQSVPDAGYGLGRLGGCYLVPGPRHGSLACSGALTAADSRPRPLDPREPLVVAAVVVVVPPRDHVSTLRLAPAGRCAYALS